MSMLTAALFIVARAWNQPKYYHKDEKCIIYTHEKVFHPYTKKNEIKSFAGKRTQLVIMLSEL